MELGTISLLMIIKSSLRTEINSWVILEIEGAEDLLHMAYISTENLEIMSDAEIMLVRERS